MNEFVPFKTVNGKTVIDMELWDILIEYEASKQKEEKIEVPFKNDNGKSVVDMVYWDILIDLQDEPKLSNDNLEITLEDKIEVPEKTIVNLEPEITKTNQESIVKPKSQKSSFAPVFRRKVYSIWRDCIVSNPHEWNNPSYVVGKSTNNAFAFYPDKILEYNNEIIMLLRFVDNANTIEELKQFNSGEEWTKLFQPVEFLMSLADALYQMKYDNQMIMEKGTARIRTK